MTVNKNTYRTLIRVFIMPTVKKIFSDHSGILGGFGVCVYEGSGEVVLALNNIPVDVNSRYGIFGSGLIDNSKNDIIYNEIINALIEMGFNRENLSFGCDTISFKNFEFHKKLLNKCEDI